MKIIAKVPDIDRRREKFIVEIGAEELANLCGYVTLTDRECPAFSIGATIKVGEMYQQLYRLADAQKRLKDASATLHSIANLVLVMNPIIEEVVEGKKEE